MPPIHLSFSDWLLAQPSKTMSRPLPPKTASITNRRSPSSPASIPRSSLFASSPAHHRKSITQTNPIMAPTAFVPSLSILIRPKTFSVTTVTPAAPTPSIARPYPHPIPHIPTATPLSNPPAPAKGPTRILLWFHTDLRLHDNPALTSALRTATLPGGALVPVAQPSAAATPLAAELKERLSAAGSGLITPTGAPDEALLSICERLKLTAVYFNRSTHPAAVAIERRVADALQAAGIRVEAFWGNVLPGMDNLIKAKNVTIRDVFKAVRKDCAEFVAPPEELPALPQAAAAFNHMSLVGKMGGGTNAAMRVLTSLDKGRETLVLSRNADIAVLLKTHLDYGSVSPRMVAAAIKRVMNGLSGRTFSELVWRAYVSIIAHRAVGATVKTAVA